MSLVSLLEQLPRVVYLVFSVYALAVLVTRWPVTRVMTTDRRYLFLFFLLEIATTTLSGALKIAGGVPVDLGTYATVLTQVFLAAYLHHTVPGQYRRWYYRFTRGRARAHRRRQ